MPHSTLPSMPGVSTTTSNDEASTQAYRVPSKLIIDPSLVLLRMYSLQHLSPHSRQSTLHILAALVL